MVAYRVDLRERHASVRGGVDRHCNERDVGVGRLLLLVAFLPKTFTFNTRRTKEKCDSKDAWTRHPPPPAVVNGNILMSDGQLFVNQGAVLTQEENTEGAGCGGGGGDRSDVDGNIL